MRRSLHLTRSMILLGVGLLMLSAGAAQAQVDSPGNHIHYAVDVEPHLIV